MAKLEAGHRALAERAARCDESAPGDEPRGEAAWVADAAPVANVVPLRPRRTRTVWLAYTVAAAVAAGGVGYAVGHQRVEEPRHEEPLPPVDSAAPVVPPAPAPPPPDPTPAPPSKHEKAPAGGKAPR